MTQEMLEQLKENSDKFLARHSEVLEHYLEKRDYFSLAKFITSRYNQMLKDGEIKHDSI